MVLEWALEEKKTYIYIYIYIHTHPQFYFLFLAVLGLGCCTSFSLVATSGSYSRVVACRLLIAVASLMAEHGLQVCGFQ